MLLVNLVSKPKKGKTVSACTFPKPMAFIDLDRGFKSAKNTKIKGTNTLVVPDWEKIKVFELYKKEVTALNFNTYQLVKGNATGPAPDYAKNGPVVMGEFMSILKDLDAGKYGDIQTLVIDNLTAMFRIWRDTILTQNNIPELRRGDYMTLEGVLVNQFIPNLKSLNDKIPYIICISHEDYDKNTEGQIVNEFPVGPSKALGQGMSEHFDEVWRMDMFGDKYIWRTKSSGLFKSAGSRYDLPDTIDANFKALEPYLKEVKN